MSVLCVLIFDFCCVVYIICIVVVAVVVVVAVICCTVVIYAVRLYHCMCFYCYRRFNVLLVVQVCCRYRCRRWLF